MSYTFVDSFCGAGGLTLGLQTAGFNHIWSFDNDTFSVQTQKLNKKYFLKPAELLDVKKLKPGDALRMTGLKKGELFLFTGGPPCQGFSIQRIGKDTDARNDLVLKFAEVVVELFPKYFLMENVPGIFGRRGVEVITDAKDLLVKNGYKIYAQVVNANEHGVPQCRRRAILIGVREDLGDVEFKFPTPKKSKVTVRSTISKLPPPPEDGSDHPLFVHHRRDRLTELNIKRLQALKPGQGREYLPYGLLADCHKNSSSKIGHRNVYGRMAWDDVAPTITARFDSFTRGLFGHPEQNRSISLREGAMLQTFPDDFIFSGNKVEVARQIGNAVPVKLAEQLGLSIISHYSQVTAKMSA